jgi:hypothetical protein
MRFREGREVGNSMKEKKEKDEGDLLFAKRYTAGIWT